ncbi:hypothetical protein HK102_012873 [Quaeritorhiza haematococci]|nr:hypothetical protein HK102_012873 [Quaeritorhiza haematococci]
MVGGVGFVEEAVAWERARERDDDAFMDVAGVDLGVAVAMGTTGREGGDAGLVEDGVARKPSPDDDACIEVAGVELGVARDATGFEEGDPALVEDEGAPGSSRACADDACMEFAGVELGGTIFIGATGREEGGAGLVEDGVVREPSRTRGDDACTDVAGLVFVVVAPDLMDGSADGAINITGGAVDAAGLGVIGFTVDKAVGGPETCPYSGAKGAKIMVPGGGGGAPGPVDITLGTVDPDGGTGTSIIVPGWGGIG